MDQKKTFAQEFEAYLQNLELQDKRTVFFSFLAVFSLPLFFAPFQLPLARQLGLDIFFPLLLLMLFFPYAIFHQLKFARSDLHLQLKKYYERKQRKIHILRILFRSRYRPLEQGTFWEIKNANRFSWTHAKVLIEREHEGMKTCERHHIGELDSGATFSFHSKLSEEGYSKWRIMVITAENRSLDFPDRWKIQEIRESAPAAETSVAPEPK